MAGKTDTDPVKLSVALVSMRVLPGDVLYLLEGTYPGDFVASIAGTEAAPVTVMPYNGGRVVIDGGLTANGAHVIWKDIEFTWSGWTTRVSAEAGSVPSDIPKHNVDINGTGNKLINCVLYNLFSPGWWSAAQGGEMYGCLSFHHGWRGPDRGHGHALYTQNQTGTKIIKDCFFHDCFGYGFHAYTSGGYVDNYRLEGNTFFNSGQLHGVAYPDILLGADTGGHVAQAPHLDANMTYGGARGDLGYVAGATGVVLTDNYLVPDLDKADCVIDTETGNYYGSAVGNTYFLRGNAYDDTRANLTIYNQAEADTVAVDVSALGWTGQVTARNVQDYFNDAQTLEIVDGTITVNMQAGNRTVATPVGWTAPATTFPRFGAFVLEKI